VISARTNTKKHVQPHSAAQVVELHSAAPAIQPMASAEFDADSFELECTSGQPMSTSPEKQVYLVSSALFTTNKVEESIAADAVAKKLPHSQSSTSNLEGAQTQISKLLSYLPLEAECAGSPRGDWLATYIETPQKDSPSKLRQTVPQKASPKEAPAKKHSPMKDSPSKFSQNSPRTDLSQKAAPKKDSSMKASPEKESHRKDSPKRDSPPKLDSYLPVEKESAPDDPLLQQHWSSTLLQQHWCQRSASTAAVPGLQEKARVARKTHVEAPSAAKGVRSAAPPVCSIRAPESSVSRSVSAASYFDVRQRAALAKHLERAAAASAAAAARAPLQEQQQLPQPPGDANKAGTQKKESQQGTVALTPVEEVKAERVNALAKARLAKKETKANKAQAGEKENQAGVKRAAMSRISQRAR